MDESRIGQYSISVTTYPIMALVLLQKKPILLNKLEMCCEESEEESIQINVDLHLFCIFSSQHIRHKPLCLKTIVCDDNHACNPICY